MNKAQIINEAAEIIEQNALHIRDSYTVRGQWIITGRADQEAYEQYMREMQRAADLREIAQQHQDDDELEL